MTAWHVLYCAAHAELRAADDLRAAGFDVLVPMGKRWVRPRHTKSRREVSRPAFPRYVFLQMDYARPGHDWMTVRETDGVESVLCNNSAPVRVADRTIEDLRVAQDMGLFDEDGIQPVIRFHKGDKVEITEGPLGGYIATVRKAPKGKGEVVVDLINNKLFKATRVPFDKLKVVA